MGESPGQKKPKGSDTLNDLYRELLKLELVQCKDAVDFATKLKSVHTDITNLSPALKLETNFLTFLFHTGLGKGYDAYFTHYTQNHKPMNEENNAPAQTLEYATSRFIKTFATPSSQREESIFAIAASFPYGSKSEITVDPQPGALPGPDSQVIRKLVNYCTHCKKTYHTKLECILLTEKSPQSGNAKSGGNVGKKNGNNERNDRKPRDKKSGKDKASKKRARYNSVGTSNVSRKALKI